MHSAAHCACTEAEELILQWGRNELEEKTKSKWKILLEQVQNNKKCRKLHMFWLFSYPTLISCANLHNQLCMYTLCSMLRFSRASMLALQQAATQHQH
jgi:Cation transporter/ATPase, N-terminus